jgi:hypothetical protein
MLCDYPSCQRVTTCDSVPVTELLDWKPRFAHNLRRDLIDSKKGMDFILKSVGIEIYSNTF